MKCKKCGRKILGGPSQESVNRKGSLEENTETDNYPEE